MAQSADPWKYPELGGVCAPSRTSSVATPAHHPFLVLWAIIGELCLRNRVREFCTLGSVRGAVVGGHGEPKRARCRKRQIQPRGYLRTGSSLPYSEAPNFHLALSLVLRVTGNSVPGSCEKIDGVHRSLTVAALKALPNQSRARQQAAGNAALSIFSQLPVPVFPNQFVSERRMSRQGRSRSRKLPRATNSSETRYQGQGPT